MDSKLIQIGERVFNIDSIQLVRKLDNGSVKIFTTIPDNDKRMSQYEYSGDEAAKIFSFFSGKAAKVV